MEAFRAGRLGPTAQETVELAQRQELELAPIPSLSTEASNALVRLKKKTPVETPMRNVAQLAAAQSTFCWRETTQCGPITRTAPHCNFAAIN